MVTGHMRGKIVKCYTGEHFICLRFFVRNFLIKNDHPETALTRGQRENVICDNPKIALGGAVASWLARSTPERALWVRDLPGDIVLCSWARHFTLTVPLSTQVYKWVPANLMLGVTLRWTTIPSRGK